MSQAKWRPPANQSDLTLAPYVLRYIGERKARGELQEITCRGVRNTLWKFAQSFGGRPLDRLTTKAVEKHLERLGHMAPSTRRNHLSAIRYFCRWMVAHGYIQADPTALVAKIRQPRKPPRNLTRDQVHALMDAVVNEREAAVLWLMVGCGLRAVEISRLELADYDRVDRTIRVRGKGGHERVLPVPDEVRTQVDRYLITVEQVSGPLIQSELRPTCGISPSQVSNTARRVFIRAGLKVRNYDGVSPHALRATAASDVLDRCGDLTVVKDMLGHASLQTTSIYLRNASMGAMRDAMADRDYRADPAPADADERLVGLVDGLLRDVVGLGLVDDVAGARRLVRQALSAT